MKNHVKSRFEIVFDFDYEGEPPQVFVAYGGECRWIEVLEEPALKTVDWSNDQEDWNPGPIAKALCELMNKFEWARGRPGDEL